LSARYFVLLRDHEGRRIVGDYATQAEAESHQRTLIAAGWPKTHTASVYRADSRQQFEDYLAERVRLVCTAVGAGYWESPEGLEQAERAREQEERDLQEDFA
jgi:hypothetical protein